MSVVADSQSSSAGITAFAAPKTILRRMQRRQVVAFVGAGFSMLCGMPGWGALLLGLLRDARDNAAGRQTLELLRACETAVDSGHHAMAASILRGVLSPGDFDEGVRGRFGLNVLHRAPAIIQERMLRRMRNLVSAPWAGIVTTNYDELIETALGRWTAGDTVQCAGDDPRLGTILASAPRGGLFFVKIHGSVSGSRIVLSTDEYDRMYIATPQVSSFLTALMLRYHLAFIGCSLEDEVLRLRRRLSSYFSGHIPTACALLPDDEANRLRSQWLREFAQVEALLYPANEDHTGVDNFLAQAAAQADMVSVRGLSDGTQAELHRVSPRERLRRIGDVNQRLLEYVVSQPDETVCHSELLRLGVSWTPGVTSALSGLTADELVYRVLFLVSIGLLFEEPTEDGTSRYTLSNDGRIALRS